MRKLYDWLHDNSLSLTFFALFILSAGAQSFVGRTSYNSQLAARHLPPIGYLAYLGTGNFLDAIFSNWQAAILQLACLILFSEILHQKGASHSRKPEHDPRRPAPKRNGRKKAEKRSVRHPEPWIYRHSLSLAFAVIFIASFLGHIFFGHADYNETRALTGDPPVSVAAYLGSGSFWFKLAQTWQAEFFGIGVFIVLSIFLREERSAESKPIESGNQETGETND